jgi:hypothetical protein
VVLRNITPFVSIFAAIPAENTSLESLSITKAKESKSKPRDDRARYLNTTLKTLRLCA